MKQPVKAGMAGKSESTKPCDDSPLLLRVKESSDGHDNEPRETERVKFPLDLLLLKLYDLLLEQNH